MSPAVFFQGVVDTGIFFQSIAHWRSGRYCRPKQVHGDIKKETQDLLTALQTYTVNQRDRAIQQIQTALDSLDERIDALETRIDNNWDSMSSAIREKTRKSLKLLCHSRVEVAEWLGSLKTSSADAWEHVKKGFSEAYQAFSDEWEKTELTTDVNAK